MRRYRWLPAAATLASGLVVCCSPVRPTASTMDDRAGRQFIPRSVFVGLFAIRPQDRPLRSSRPSEATAMLRGVGRSRRLAKSGISVCQRRAGIGLELAPCCFSRTGTDVSAKTLEWASDRMRGVSNARLALLQQDGLGKFGKNCFDVVYATNMFAHLDEVDLWCYVQEAFCVLRPAGHIFIDNYQPRL